MSLPLYYVADLSRLPPVDVNHCDVSAILAELQYLRAEVRAMGQLSDEMAVLRQEISQLRQLKAEFNDVRNDFAKMSGDKEEFPLLPGHAAEAGDQDIVADEAGSAGPTRVAGSQLFTDHARQLKDVGIKQLAGNKRSSGISI